MSRRDQIADALGISPGDADTIRALLNEYDGRDIAAVLAANLTGVPPTALDDLTDVDTAGGTEGDVLTQQNNGSFALEAPSGGSQTQYRWGYDRVLFSAAIDPDDISAGSYAIYHSDPSGSALVRATPVDTGLYNYLPSWEPTERKIVLFTRYVNETGRYDVAICDTTTGEVTVLTDGFTDAQAPGSGGQTYSPDGQTILFAAYTDEVKSDIYAMDADGGNQRIIIDNADIGADIKLAPTCAPMFSPDGTKFIIAAEQGHAGALDGFYVANADGSSPTRILSVTDFGLSPGDTWYQFGNAWGRNDKLAVCVSLNDGSHPNIWICDTDGGNLAVLTSTDSYYRAEWNPDASRLIAISYTDAYQIEMVDPNDGSAVIVRQFASPTYMDGGQIDWGRNSPDTVPWSSGGLTIPSPIGASPGDILTIGAGGQPEWAAP